MYLFYQKLLFMWVYLMLVKLFSFGGIYNKIICGLLLLLFVLLLLRKGLMGCIDKLVVYDISDVRKINLCCRYFKFLDIFLLLREINWIVFDVDIYYFYESVLGNQVGENNNIVEFFYVSVSSDEKVFCSESSGRVSF